MSKGRPSFKQPAKAKDKSKAQPQTADDFLADGVNLEEAGEKWRAGDAAKALRFFQRAIDTYGEGVRRFPDSFELAYNKGRLSFEVFQQPRLIEHLPSEPYYLLEQALTSLRAALALDRQDADALFNTAQVLTTLGEISPEIQQEDAAIPRLEGAIETFVTCLTVQQQTRAAHEMFPGMPIPKPTDPDVDPPMSRLAPPADAAPNSTSTQSEEEWAIVIPPISLASIFDTVHAALNAILLLLPLLAAAGPSAIAASAISTPKLSQILEAAECSAQTPVQRAVIALDRAKLAAALANADFCARSIDLQAYADALDKAFGPDAEGAPVQRAAFAFARAVAAFNAAAAAAYRSAEAAPAGAEPLPPALALSDLRWSFLTRALSALGAADAEAARTQKAPSAAAVAPRSEESDEAWDDVGSPAPSRGAINALRGDLELLRAALREPPRPHELAVQNVATLLRNAATYYAGAKKLALQVQDEEVEAEDMAVREGAARALAGEMGLLQKAASEDQEQVKEVLTEMVDEGMLTAEWVRSVGS